MLTKFIYVACVHVVYAILATVTTIVSYRENISLPFYIVISMLEIGTLLMVWAILLF